MHAGTFCGTRDVFHINGYPGAMRGGLERWKRGVGSQGVRQALAYAFQGSCDSHVRAAVGC